jgi:hypothetical protein
MNNDISKFFPLRNSGFLTDRKLLTKNKHKTTLSESPLSTPRKIDSLLSSSCVSPVWKMDQAASINLKDSQSHIRVINFSVSTSKNKTSNTKNYSLVAQKEMQTRTQTNLGVPLTKNSPGFPRSRNLLHAQDLESNLMI